MVTGPLAPDELAGLIAAGEDSFTEFKDPGESTKDLAKELCAFLNAVGGRVLIGVDDDGRVVGLGDWSEEKVMNVARTLLDPPAIPTFQVVIPPGTSTSVAVVAVDTGPEKPYALGGGEGKRYYVRVGSTSREASREELIRLTQASGSVQGDLRPVPGALVEDLDDALLGQRYAGRRSIDWPNLGAEERLQVLVSADIVHPETRGPTVGGLLCFGIAPQTRMPFATVECAAYGGTSVDRSLVDRGSVSGRVDQQVGDAAAFILRNLATPSTVERLERVESPRPSTESVREAVANAVAHRHYGVAGPSLVRVFSDRVEVRSPGDLPNGVTPEAMRVGVSVRRNPFIVARLVELRLVDAVGRGFVLMVEEALRIGLPEPEIVAADGFVTLTLRLGA